MAYSCFQPKALTRTAAAVTVPVACWVAAALPALAQTESLEGTRWQLQSIQYSNDTTVTIADPSRYTLEFRENGELGIQADCNRGFGNYTQSGSELRLQPVGVTRAACGPDSASEEFLRNLPYAATFVMQEGTLFVNLSLDTGNLVFAPAPSLAGRPEVCAVVTTLPQAEDTDTLLTLLGTDRGGVVASLEALSGLMARLDDEGYGWPNVLGTEGGAPETQLQPWLIGALRMACEE